MNIEAGKTVYSTDGRKAEYVAQVNGAHVVRLIAEFTDYEGDSHFDVTDQLDMWPRVFLKPPVSVVAEEIASLRAEERAIRDQIRARRDELRETEREQLALIKRLQRYEPLKHLEPIMNGEITHVVECSRFYSTVKTFADAMIYRDDYDRKDVCRLLTLKPTEDGVIMWHISRYKDGSGSSQPCWPCISYEEACEVARKVLVESLDSYNYDTHPHLWVTVADSAEKAGLELPEDITAKANACRVKQADEAVAKASAALAAAQAKRATVPAPSAEDA